MKKTLVFIITIAITYCIAFAMGRNEVIPTKEPIGVIYTDYKEAYYAEKAIAASALELLHRFYGNDDNDFWYECVMHTKEYQKLDSAMNNDWEDFYYYESPNLLWDYFEGNWDEEV